MAKIKTHTVTPPVRQLKAGWTIEPKVDIESYMSEEAASELAKAIDEELVKTIEIEHLISVEGWTKVELSRFNSMMHAVDINNWVDDNCGPHTRYGSTYAFKEAKDATWFILKWASHQ